MTGLRDVDLLHDIAWCGAVSCEALPDGGVQPWRLPHDRRSLFVGGDLLCRARMPAGVRLVMVTGSRLLVIQLRADADCSPLDVVVDGSIRRVTVTRDPVVVDLADGETRVELWLPQYGEVEVARVAVEAGATCVPGKVTGPRWIAHGSSITQCRHAPGPLETWPTLVARRLGFDLLNLGFGGQCLLDPMVARLVRDSSAELVTLCLGINVFGQATHDRRSLLPALLGFLSTVRDGHPRTPLVVISPLGTRVPADERNAVGLTLDDVRRAVSEAVRLLVADGDPHLSLVDGTDLLGHQELEHLVDRVHPGDSGYRLVADRMAPLLDGLLGQRES